MKFIIDLDRTLIDTDQFREDIIELAEGHAITREEFGIAYKGDDAKKVCFTPEKLSDGLSEKLGGEKAEFEQQIYSLFSEKNKSYFYEGAIDFLQKLRAKGQMILLTRGNQEFQKFKIEHLALKDFFDEVVVDHQPKEEICHRWNVEGEEVVFVNDNEEEIKLLKGKCPNWYYVHVQFNDKNKSENSFNNYQDIIKYIESLQP